MATNWMTQNPPGDIFRTRYQRLTWQEKLEVDVLREELEARLR